MGAGPRILRQFAIGVHAKPIISRSKTTLLTKEGCPENLPSVSLVSPAHLLARVEQVLPAIFTVQERVNFCQDGWMKYLVSVARGCRRSGGFCVQFLEFDFESNMGVKWRRWRKKRQPLANWPVPLVALTTFFSLLTSSSSSSHLICWSFPLSDENRILVGAEPISGMSLRVGSERKVRINIMS